MNKIDIDERKANLILNLIGDSKIVETVADDQLQDEDYNDAGYRQRIDARLDVIRKTAVHIASLAEEIGDLEEDVTEEE